jgi:hypothetical protein
MPAASNARQVGFVATSQDMTIAHETFFQPVKCKDGEPAWAVRGYCGCCDEVETA